MTDKFNAILWEWRDGAMHPPKRMEAMCANLFSEGEWYRLEPREERSGVQHRWYFASINECFKNLPEDVADRFTDPEHLRKWALVKAGYCTESMLVLSTEEQARDVAKAARKLDSYAVIVVKDSVVQIFTAKSQSVRHMDKKEFKESADKVLDILANLIGTTASELKKQDGGA